MNQCNIHNVHVFHNTHCKYSAYQSCSYGKTLIVQANLFSSCIQSDCNRVYLYFSLLFLFTARVKQQILRLEVKAGDNVNDQAITADVLNKVSQLKSALII